MSLEARIVRNRQLPVGQDYAVLRKLGLKMLERLATDHWDDFNVHDPGVSIWEVLCYAMTDPALRSELPIEDLLARASQSATAGDFFTALQILTCNPVTAQDFRRIVIDRPGVENAWLQDAGDRPTFHTVCHDGSSAYRIRLTDDVAGSTPRYLRGLWDVAVQLEEDDEFGDLNRNVLEAEIEIDGSVRSVKIVFPRVELEFPSWDHPIVHAQDYDDLTNPTVARVDTSGQGVTFDWRIRFRDTHDNEHLVTLTGVRALGVPDDQFATLQGRLESSARGSLADFFMRRARKIVEILCDVYCILHAHRNLCEDFVRFTVVPHQEIGICADVEIAPDADADAVLARVHFEIDRFLAPPIRFYTLEEMLARNRPVEEIFEATVPEHGFIDEEELEASQLRSEIHVSDLYRIVMDDPAVVAVPRLLVTAYLDGLPGEETRNEPWCLKLGGPFHLNLSFGEPRSRIRFQRDGIPFRANHDRAHQLIRDMRARARRPKLALSDRNLPVPAGARRELSDYVSLQTEFPRVYGVGRDGLPAEATAERRAQAKQLKAFLMIFDQLLANHLAQLDHVKDLLSVKPPAPLETTYAVQALYRPPKQSDRDDFPDVANLFVPFLETLDGTKFGPAFDNKDDDFRPHWDPLTESDFAAYSASLKRDFERDWNTFTDDPANSYLTALKDIAEGEPEFLKRRNRFLDHLLARFGETFSDYPLLMAGTGQDEGADGEGAGQTREELRLKRDRRLVDAKLELLADYPKVSRERGKAFQYKCTEPEPGEAWDSDNVSGLERRIARLVGIDDVSRSTLGFTAAEIRDAFAIGQGPGGRWRFDLEVGGEAALRSDGLFDTERMAFEGACNVVELGYDPARFVVKKLPGNQFGFDVVDDDRNVVAVGVPQNTERRARRRIAEIVQDLHDKFYPNREGLHLFENILFRPVRNTTVGVGDIEGGFYAECNLDNDCECPIRDPYSFRMTIVLPFWPQRFQREGFREHIEQTIRRETPAHIVPRICWIGAKDMFGLERRYRAWWEEARKKQPERGVLAGRTKRLVMKLNRLTTVYPEGVLHDCSDPQAKKNKVILDRTHI